MTRRRDELDEVLKELRQEHREIAAPESLEARLRAAARTVRPVEVPRAPLVSIWNWRWGFAIAAAVVVIGLAVWGAGRSAQAPVRQAGVETNSNPAPVEAPQEVAVADAGPAGHDLLQDQDVVRSAERRRRTEGLPLLWRCRAAKDCRRRWSRASSA